MAPKSKKVTDINKGDQYTIVKTVVGKLETMTAVTLYFDDGTSLEFPLDGDPALAVTEPT